MTVTAHKITPIRTVVGYEALNETIIQQVIAITGSLLTIEQKADIEEGDLSDFDSVSPTFVWDQTADLEEGRPTDVDSTSPAWDHTVLEGVADFDSETDADGDLNTSAAAAKLGTNGCRVTFDDSNTAYGVVSATAIDQTEGVVDVWLDPSSITLDDGSLVRFFRAVDGGGTDVFDIDFRNNAGAFEVRALYRADGAGLSAVGAAQFAAGWIPVSSNYVHLRYVFKVSTGAGNDDGYCYFYVDDGGITTASTTGIDNDTRDWDNAWFGMVLTTSTGFGGSFDIDEIRVSESVSPVWITEAAALSGSYGMAVTVEDTTRRYASFDDPASETQVVFECEFDPNGITIPSGNEFVIAAPETGGGNTVAIIYLGHDGSNYYVTGSHRNDSGFQDTRTAMKTTITDAVHTVRVAWRAATGAGNDDGYYYLYLDGNLIGSVTGIDSDTVSFENVRFGAHSSIDSGTSGVFYMDNMRWSNDTTAPYASEYAALSGTYGMAVGIEDTTARYGSLTDPTNESQIVMECEIDPNGMTIPDTDFFYFMFAKGSGTGGNVAAAALRWLDSGSTFNILFPYWDDAASFNNAGNVNITDAPHTIRVVVIPSSGAGNNDGELYCYVDGVLIASVTNADNDGHDIDEILFGAVADIDSGTSGVFYMDNMLWSTDTSWAFEDVLSESKVIFNDAAKRHNTFIVEGVKR